MTVESSIAKAGPYAGAGLVGPFTVNFRFLDQTHLQVVQTSATGVETTLTLLTQYTVLGAGGSSGTVTLVTALPVGQFLTILRNVPITQLTDYVQSDSFPAQSHEDALDKGIMIAQQQAAALVGTLRVPETATTLPALPPASARASQLLGFDSSGNPVAVAAVSGSATQLALDLLTSTVPTKGPGQIGFSYATNYVVGTIGAVAKSWGIDMTQPPFSCDSAGAADCSAAANVALTTYPGIPLLFPKGTYRFDTTVSIKGAPTWSVFGIGALIRGAGVGSTFLDNRVPNAPLFDVDSDSHGGTFHANMGTTFEHFNLMTTTSPVASTGIRVLNGYQVTFNNLVIKGMTQDGIELRNGLYTDDGWNRVAIIQVWIEACARWGIKSDGSAGRNEGSYTYIRNLFLQSNGTASAATPPPSGGMIWKGQALVIEDSGAANGNQNVALFIKGDTGLGNTVDIRTFTSENTTKRGIYCTGVDLLKMRNVQIYNNDTFVATSGIEFDGATYTVRNVDIDGVVVRATAGNNAFTAFKISGANAALDSCRVRNVSWENFDFAGQTRFNGWQFDLVPQCCDVVALSTTSVVFRPNQTIPRGNRSPLRLRGGLGGTPSTSGEWVATAIGSAGIGISNAALAASTRYYCYLYDNVGSTMLELSTTAFAADTATGYAVKTGDATRLYLGSVVTDAGSLFVIAGAGWLNPMLIPGSQTGVYVFAWCDSTTRFRVKATAPTSDTDGTVVGTQV